MTTRMPNHAPRTQTLADYNILSITQRLGKVPTLTDMHRDSRVSILVNLFQPIFDEVLFTTTIYMQRSDQIRAFSNGLDLRSREKHCTSELVSRKYLLPLTQWVSGQPMGNFSKTMFG